jgi:hypothetical protein
MFQYIYTGDSIDQGRMKINSLLFTGFTEGYWASINSGSTGFSLEFSATSASYPLSNTDTSSNSNNIFIGNNNTIFGSEGYNFLQGQNNSLASSENSYAAGQNLILTGLSNSFIQGSDIKIYSGNSITILGGEKIHLSAATLTNNYLTFLNNYNLSLQSLPSSSNKHINYLTIFGNTSLKISADCDYVSIINGDSNTLSGTVRNVSIFGSNNSIGYNQNATTKNYEDIYIFGNGLSPLFSSDTMSPLSGTYISDLCIENGLALNYDRQTIGKGTYVISIGGHAYPNPNPVMFFDKKNVGILSTVRGIGELNFSSTATANLPANQSTSGLFFATYRNTANCISSLSGDPTYFIDNYNGTNNGRWDIPLNHLSANTVFMTYMPAYGVQDVGGHSPYNIFQYIKIKG